MVRKIEITGWIRSMVAAKDANGSICVFSNFKKENKNIIIDKYYFPRIYEVFIAIEPDFWEFVKLGLKDTYFRLPPDEGCQKHIIITSLGAYC